MGQRLLIVAAGCCVVFLMAHRIWRYSTFMPEPPEMPTALADDEERDLFHTVGGKYSQADIAANGPVLPSQKYRGLRTKHDFQPRPGDPLCPVTLTKANSGCTWIIDGQTYQFCCPPCIGEFVRTAKEQPEQIRRSEEYVATAE